MRLGNWQGVAQPAIDPKVLAVLGADDYLFRSYVREGRGVGLYVGYWGSQRQGDTIHSPLNCLPGAGWQPVTQQIVDVPDPRGPEGTQIPLNRVVIQKGLDRQLVYYWYQSGRRIVASEYWGKFYLVADAMRYNRSDGAIVRLTIPLPAGTAAEDAERTGMAFAEVLLRELPAYLPE